MRRRRKRRRKLSAAERDARIRCCDYVRCCVKRLEYLHGMHEGWDGSCRGCVLAYDPLFDDPGCLLLPELRGEYIRRVQENNTPEELLAKLKDARAFLLDVLTDDLKRAAV